MNEVIHILIIAVNRFDMSLDRHVLVAAGGRSQSMPKFKGRRAPDPQICILRRTDPKPRIRIGSHSDRVSQSNEDVVPVRVVPITHNLAAMIIEILMFPILGEFPIISVSCAIFARMTLPANTKIAVIQAAITQRVFMSSPSTYACRAQQTE